MAQSRCWFCDRPVDPSMAVEDGGVTFCSGSCANEHRRTLGRAEQASRKYPQRVMANPQAGFPYRAPAGGYVIWLKDRSRIETDAAGRIVFDGTRNMTFAPSDSWRIRGIARRHLTGSHIIPLDAAADGADIGQGWIYDIDHGTTRMWGGPSARRAVKVERITEARSANPDCRSCWGAGCSDCVPGLDETECQRCEGTVEDPDRAIMCNKCILETGSEAGCPRCHEVFTPATAKGRRCPECKTVFRASNPRSAPAPFSRADNAEALAAEFSRVLARHLGPRKLAECIRRNRAERNPSICHSHDFVDANMTMEEAFRRTQGRRPVMPSEAEGTPTLQRQADEDVDLWVAAWDLAKKAEFRPLSIGKRSRNPDEWDKLRSMGRAAARRFVKEG